ncbi:MAG: flagellar basal body rod protein FlgC [Candidatus Eremiobacteraeota bacterium]|nr:flagellar basal body rod protein FlgC [Candidatus Eremiobacteraeota bacterium]MBV8721442.1 flagellar basal body rod protein FlgC [Candidatus Eremiobacteraeota bacterium]
MAGFYNTVEISASALSAERLAMDVIANNIANANTTRTPQGGAFKRQLIVFSQTPGAPAAADNGFPAFGTNGSAFSPDSNETPPNVEGVQALGIVNDNSPDRLVFDPGNPEADARGYVHYPNVQIVKEMVDMMAASRAYEANVAVIAETKSMSTASLGLLQS